MLTQLEAEVDTNGVVRLLEPFKSDRKARAIVTIIDSRPLVRLEMTEEEARLAEDRFARHFGAVNSGDPASADNEKVDADLARAYSDDHADE